MRPAVLALADGNHFWGRSYGYDKTAAGELVFNTAMSGYQEILTDPSYAGQIITFTYPHIGNTGINNEDSESAQIHAAAVVLREPSPIVSNYRAHSSLEEFLYEQKCTAITHIDTRCLTRLLRDKGCQNACIMHCQNKKDKQAVLKKAQEKAAALPPLRNRHWAQTVSSKKVIRWREGVWQPKAATKKMPSPFSRKKASPCIAVYDCGVKHNILRLLHNENCKVIRIPMKKRATEILRKYEPAGILISNGPGDPDVCQKSIEDIRFFLSKDIPLFGICLGHQLLGMACRLKTYKMKHGHHGANHPVKDLLSGQVIITSQNHNFAVSEDSLPNNIRITHRSLFDNSIQGIELLHKPAFSFQGHPEASPGPHDISYLFRKFADMAAHA